MAAVDDCAGSLGVDFPATSAVAVVTNDSTDLAKVSRALYVGSTGDVKVTMMNGQVVTFASVAVGWMPIRVSRVWATGTAASSIVAVW